MKNKYGHFTKDGSEYVITRPDTPRPWINYLTNGSYCAVCSNIGGGFSFYKDHRVNSILRRGKYAHLEDMPGRLIYIKDEETGEIWNINVFPIGKYDSYEARHGMGYTEISSWYKLVESSVRYFVPESIDAEMWEVKLSNNGAKARKLSVYAFADFVLGNVIYEEGESRFMSLFNDSVIGDKDMLLLQRWWKTQFGPNEADMKWIWDYRVFMTTTVKPVKMLTNKDAFMGPFRSYSNPAGLEETLLPDGLCTGKDLAGICQWRLTLAPGKTWEMKLSIGIQSNEDSAGNREMILRLQKPGTYIDAWKETQDARKHLVGSVTVQTPDDDINTMVNYWNKHQLSINFNFGRGPSYFHKYQYPAMRDSCQDAFGMNLLEPSLAKENIKRVAHFFYKDGSCCGGCNRVGLPETQADKVDLPLWLTLAVADYIRETGDFSLLDEEIQLMDGGSSTVYQKMTAGIERKLEERGAHGLPLMGRGDWNDAADMVGVKGKGESVWLAQFLYFVMSEIRPFLERKGDLQRLSVYEQRSKELWDSVNNDCWDGEWFTRAFKDDGTPVGVKGQKEGFIWINSQTWAVIGQVSDSERLNTCMDSVEKHMGTEYGLTNLAPAYSGFDDTIGIISAFKSGWKENGAVFSHASAFNVVARAKLGRGKDAVDLFKRILPSYRNPDIYLMEPYVYSQFCAGPDSGPDFGTGAYHWLSGTAAWMLRAMTDHIIGVHSEFEGLRISPAVDPSWKTFSIRRRFRGAVYDIEFSNPNGVETGVKEIFLDGNLIEGNLLPLPTSESHCVKVIMG